MRMHYKTRVLQNNTSLTGPPPFVTLDSRFNPDVFP